MNKDRRKRIQDIKDQLVNIGNDPMSAKAAGTALAVYAANAKLTTTGKSTSSDELVDSGAGASRL